MITLDKCWGLTLFPFIRNDFIIQNIGIQKDADVLFNRVTFLFRVFMHG